LTGNLFCDGTSIDSHGDAHANDGFVRVRKATVVGEIKNNRFVVSSFKLFLKKRKQTEIVSLIIQNITKHISLTEKNNYCFYLKLKRILLKLKLFY
jgi:hypothetical protein